MNQPDTGEIERRVRELGEWFHNIHLNGVQTAPEHFLGDYPAVKWRSFSSALPENLRGKSVLDIGCNGGFYSIELKRRGARRVVAIDSDERYLAQARYAAEISNVEVEFRNLNVYQVPELGERFDLVLFLGVLYHLRHPLLALDLLYDHVVGDCLVFQSLQRGALTVSHLAENYLFSDQTPFEQPGYPALYFVEKMYAGDPSNWWIPNRACVEAMLRSSGFEIQSHPEEEVYICSRRPERSQE